MQTETAETTTDWSDVNALAEANRELDKLRAELASVKTLHATALADLAEAREHLVKGALLEARREATRIGSPRALEVVNTTAGKFGVTL